MPRCPAPRSHGAEKSRAEQSAAAEEHRARRPRPASGMDQHRRPFPGDQRLCRGGSALPESGHGSTPARGGAPPAAAAAAAAAPAPPPLRPAPAPQPRLSTGQRWAGPPPAPPRSARSRLPPLAPRPAGAGPGPARREEPRGAGRGPRAPVRLGRYRAEPPARRPRPAAAILGTGGERLTHTAPGAAAAAVPCASPGGECGRQGQFAKKTKKYIKSLAAVSRRRGAPAAPPAVKMAQQSRRRVTGPWEPRAAPAQTIATPSTRMQFYSFY